MLLAERKASMTAKIRRPRLLGGVELYNFWIPIQPSLLEISIRNSAA